MGTRAPPPRPESSPAPTRRPVRRRETRKRCAGSVLLVGSAAGSAVHAAAGPAPWCALDTAGSQAPPASEPAAPFDEEQQRGTGRQTVPRVVRSESPRGAARGAPIRLSAGAVSRSFSDHAPARRFRGVGSVEAGPAANSPGPRAVLRQPAPSAPRQRTLEANGIDCGASVLRSGLRRERWGSRSDERSGKNRQVGMEPDPIQATNAKRCQRPFMRARRALPLQWGDRATASWKVCFACSIDPIAS
jgi:hypothetical protein